ncbi:MAG TPA: 4-alpha-glucanotransferase [Thermoanaerobaculia bacterium]|nr:4-alpha-glucanotransferase [Thermoanaerobaculia bacterium]
MAEEDDLRELARLYGVQTSYDDALGRHVEADRESLVAVLSALGAGFDRIEDAAEALRERQQELAGRVIEPVLVAWDGRAPETVLRFGSDSGKLAIRFDLEGGERFAWDRELSSLPMADPSGRLLSLPDNLPTGYHHLRVESGGRSGEALVISAPTRVYTGDGGDGGDGKPLWGVFLPLYALRTRESWGMGDFSDLETLAEWTASLGGGVVGTLPMLSSFLDEPFEPSPYAPASRLFWNEIYLDPRRVPELEDCPEAKRLMQSPEFRREVESLRKDWTVDYARQMSLKRRVLEELAKEFFIRPSPDRRDAFEEFAEARPELETYAAFRAVGERRGEPWQQWPERLREGTLAPADWDEDDRRYHLWVQWITDEQVGAMAKEARRRGPGLYLDLPLGVHGNSYDVWRYRDLFAEGISTGAPPDTFFTKGQTWGSPPLHPERLREHGYSYLIESLRHHLRHSGLLRIDHVMQLYRLFWIPWGMEASAGVYVRYPVEELFAVLSVESHRHKAMIVGENLGTVPPEIGEAMDRHDVLGMYVVQYELQPGSEGLRPPPARSVASLNTHDMPTFRSFWEARDVADLQDLGFFDEQQAREERERRGAIRQKMIDELPPLPPEERGGEREYAGVLRRRLDWLASSPARMVLINLEDLWGETEPQNVPGTHDERPNWRRKARYTFEELSTKPEVVDALRRVDGIRKEGGR